MQTFLPFSDFNLSAQCLDNKRLGKQRVEAWQILLTISENRKAWRNHPAVLMWQDNTISLAFYGIAICREWIRRGFKDTIYDRFWKYSAMNIGNHTTKNPTWLGNHTFHLSHQSNLLRKDPFHYGKFFPANIPHDLPYVWPSKNNL